MYAESAVTCLSAGMAMSEPQNLAQHMERKYKQEARDQRGAERTGCRVTNYL